MVEPSGQRAVSRCDELGVGPYSIFEGGLFRPYLSSAHAAAVERIAEWMIEAGMTVRLDPLASLIGRYEGATDGAPALLIGSHIDSVREAGRYDGPLGVMLGIELVASLSATGRRLPFAIEVVAFGDEEGSRFPQSMLGSRAMAGRLDPAVLAVTDAEGRSVHDALAAFSDICGIPLPSGPIHAAQADFGRVIGFVEAHIEQGPVLEAEGLAVGVVSGIAAQRRLRLTVKGRAGHAGTTAMGLRRDALAGASAIVLAAEEIATAAGANEGVVATIGQMAVAPGVPNVVPGRAVLSLDVRAASRGARDAAVEEILSAARRIADHRILDLTIEDLQDLDASPCAPALIAKMEQALAAEGHPPRVLLSGAGHDTMSFTGQCPTAMLFLRCKDGLSHHPDESVTAEDTEAALQVLRRFVDLLEETDHAR